MNVFLEAAVIIMPKLKRQAKIRIFSYCFTSCFFGYFITNAFIICTTTNLSQQLGKCQKSHDRQRANGREPVPLANEKAPELAWQPAVAMSSKSEYSGLSYP